MAKRRQIIEIFAPTLGAKSDAPTTILDPRSSPATGLQNSNLYYGASQKEYGTSLFITGSGSALGAPINHLFEAQFPNSNVLQVFSHTGVYKYTASGDTFVSDGQVFTGTYKDYWSGVMHNSAFVYCNGINPLQVKASVSATGSDMQSAVSPDTYLGWGVASLKDHLCLYHTVENGSEFYKRVRWTKKGTLVYSAGTTDFASGTAGAIDVQDCEGEIKTAVPLGAGVAVYSERSVHAQYWVGGDEIFQFSKVVSGIGTPSRRGVVSFEDVNYFLSHNNVYAYYGGDDLRPIGNPVKQAIFAELNNSSIANAFVEFDPIERQVLCHIPTGTSELPNKVWVYRIDDENWTTQVRNYTAYGRSTRKTGQSWGESVGTWGGQTIKWGDAQIRVDAAVRLYGDQSGRVVKVDNTLYTVSESGTSTPQTYIHQTPDLTGANLVDPYTKDKVDYTSTDKRWQEFEAQVFGNGTASLSYSVDQGVTFSTAVAGSPFTLVPGGTTHAFYIDERSEQIRVKITNTGTNDFIAVKYLKVQFMPGSENRG